MLSPTANLASLLLVHEASNIRISALKLLVVSSKPTEPFKELVLKALFQSLPCFHAETDAKTRNDFLGCIRSLFNRMHGTIFRMDKAVQAQRNSVPQVANINLQQLEYHQKFILDYQFHLFSELQPSASYQRRITALRALKLLGESQLRNVIDVCLSLHAHSYTR